MNIPTEPPVQGIADLSNTLMEPQITAIQNQIAGLKYNPKVLILPKDESPGDLGAFSHNLQTTWGITGDRLLLVVDLKSHKVRAITGNTLTDNGVSSDFLSREMINHYFVPYLKRNDLSGGISSALDCVNSKFVQATTPVQVPIVVNQPAAAPATIDMNPALGGGVFVAAVLSIATGAVVVFLTRSRNDDLLKELSRLENTLNTKYISLEDSKDYNPDHTPGLTAGGAFVIDCNTLFDDIQSLRKQNMFSKAISLRSAIDRAKMLIQTADDLLAQQKKAEIVEPSTPKLTTQQREIIEILQKQKNKLLNEKAKEYKPYHTNQWLHNQPSYTPIAPAAPAPIVVVAPSTTNYFSDPVRNPYYAAEQDDEPKRKSDSGSSSWGFHSSSSSDSGSSSWDSSSSSSDSGSSSWDSGSSSSDAGGDW